MKIECYGGYGYESNCYLVTDDAETEALIIDPSVSVLAMSRKRGRLIPKVAGIILTHAHFDHMLTVDEWREKTGAPLLVHEADAPALSDSVRNVYRMFMHNIYSPSFVPNNGLNSHSHIPYSPCNIPLPFNVAFYISSYYVLKSLSVGLDKNAAYRPLHFFELPLLYGIGLRRHRPRSIAHKGR